MKFIETIQKKASKHGVRILMEDSDMVYADGDKDGCAGYFDSENRILAVATGIPKYKWLGLLAHESSHMDQWLENPFVWNKLSLGYDLFFRWLNGSIVKREVLEEAVQDIIRLEKDCEVRSVKKIKEYNLPIDISEYKKKANCYLFSYLFMLESRKWVPKIYEKEKVWSTASSRFKSEYTVIPRRLYRAFYNEYNGK